jgi:hypothetical protein
MFLFSHAVRPNPIRFLYQPGHNSFQTFRRCTGVLRTNRDDREDEHDGREPDHDDEPDYRRSIPPKGYMHPEDLLRLDFPHAGLKDAAAK